MSSDQRGVIHVGRAIGPDISSLRRGGAEKKKGKKGRGGILKRKGGRGEGSITQLLEMQRSVPLRQSTPMHPAPVVLPSFVVASGNNLTNNPSSPSLPSTLYAFAHAEKSGLELS